MSGSIVQYYGSQQSKCGYCAGANCSLSHGMHAYRLDCKDYQDLIDRGWRRCGNYCYKLRNQETCCPCYTIKCNGLEFKLSKSNKRILRRINRFLRDGRRDSKPEAGEGDGEADADDAIGAPEVTASEPQPQLPDKSPTVINVDHVASLATAQKKPTKQATAPAVEAPTLGSNKSAAPISNKPCKKAKQMRLDRRRAKLGDSASISTKSVSQEKTLRDFLNTDSETNKHRLKIVLVASSDTEHTCADAVIALYRKYQITVHNDNPARLTLASMQRFLVKSPLKLRLIHVYDDEFRRTLPQSFALYKKYQISIHNDPPKNQDAYKDHLQATPLKNEKPRDGPEMGYGSFHQQYWLDDKLIAVGVIDILPGCVSSVYFFYDPDYSFLSLGTYGSLREIELVQSLAENVPSLKYYYMGFYIHSCPKMRYKGKLSPSYLLCPETYEWLPLTDVIRAKLDEHKYQRLNEDPAARDVNEFLKEHLDEVMMLLDAKTCTNYRHYRQLRGAVCDVDTIIEYGKLVGKACACRMLYVK
ncbi:Ate1 [Drosophila simulans]|uniref:Arginyl-tRNA--protein transferase 1 n=1 Tax=Drosophila simulans TaxID=7240 RepID=B4QEK9_DROSI|nr:Ate1 [Drosophila simulans]